MKTYMIYFSLIAMMPFFNTYGFDNQAAKSSRSDTVLITTSAQCGMCTDRIERMLTFERGVRSAKLNLETGVVKVVYHNKRTSPDKIRKAISMVGYDADKVEANPEAYEKLPGCCRKPNDPLYYKHD